MIATAAMEIDAINARGALPISDKRELLAHQIASEPLANKGLSMPPMHPRKCPLALKSW